MDSFAGSMFGVTAITIRAGQEERRRCQRLVRRVGLQKILAETSILPLWFDCDMLKP